MVYLINLNSRHIDIQILIALELVQHVIDRHGNSAVRLVNDRGCELDFIHQQEELLASVITDCFLYMLTQRDRIAEFIILPLIQLDSDDVIFRCIL